MIIYIHTIKLYNNLIIIKRNWRNTIIIKSNQYSMIVETYIRGFANITYELITTLYINTYWTPFVVNIKNMTTINKSDLQR